MSKPWEMELRTSATAGETACAVYDTNGRMVADLRMRFDVAAESELATLFSAAPDMARALFDMGAVDNGEWHDWVCRDTGVHGESCAAAGAALRKAGVLP